MMDNIFHDLLDNGVIVYLNDISIYPGPSEIKVSSNKTLLISMGPVGRDPSTVRSIGWWRSNLTMWNRVLD